MGSNYYNFAKFFIALPLIVAYLLYTAVVGDSHIWILFGLILYYPFHQLGFSIGIHKLLSHASFEPKSWYPKLSVVIGSICFFGDPVASVVIHRLHHKYADTDKDPHSPTQGRWHAFILWILTYKPPKVGAYFAADVLKKYPFLKTYRRFEWLVPITFHTSTFLINETLFLSCMLAAVLSIFTGFVINAFSHNPSITDEQKATDNLFLARWVNPLFMHKYHHDVPSLYDYSHKGVADFSSNFIVKFLTK